MKLADLKTSEFVDLLASDAPAPGGGSAAALEGALGAALTAMVCSLTVGKKKYADVEERMQAELVELAGTREHLLVLIDEDARAFAALDRGGEQFAEDCTVVVAAGDQHVDLVFAQLVHHLTLCGKRVFRHGVYFRADAGKCRSEDDRAVVEAVNPVAQRLIAVSLLIQYVAENAGVECFLQFVYSVVIFHEIVLLFCVRYPLMASPVCDVRSLLAADPAYDFPVF